MIRKVPWLLVGLLCWVAAALPAIPVPQVKVYLDSTNLPAGSQGVLAVVVDIPATYHTQSHTPSDKNYIPFEIAPAPTPGISFLNIIYPLGKNVTYPDLGSLNVYDGQVIAYLPLRVDKQALLGSLHLTGKVHLQMCNDHACFKPADYPFDLPVDLVAAITPRQGANAEFFRDFDPRVFAAEAPPSAAAIPSVVIQLFGWSFTLANSAYLLAFLLAFLVGIIFNLMPCVLPVLPLKALGFYETSQHHRARCLVLGLVFSLGLLAVFAGLAVLVVVQRYAWGQLFSSAWFVWTIVSILVVMAVGQLGAFAILLPSRIYSFAPDHSSLTGNFLFGGFTAILSTPCTAPMFVGLLAWASQQPAWLGISMVMMVGLGMAAPYLVLAGFPELARSLPRAGAWAELVKQFMAFLLLAVAAWFAFGRLIEGNGYLWVVFGVLVAGCVFLLVRTLMLTRRPGPIAVSAMISVFLAGGMFWLTLALTTHGPWQPYSPQLLQRALADQQVVMVEFTANWCANCKELEARVFNDPRTLQSLRDLRVLALRADLTRDDAAGWMKLKEITPSGGIPMTDIYSPLLASPIQLSSIYTTDNLVAALDQATRR